MVIDLVVLLSHVVPGWEKKVFFPDAVVASEGNVWGCDLRAKGSYGAVMGQLWGKQQQ